MVSVGLTGRIAKVKMAKEKRRFAKLTFGLYF
jgi:hypothetical protein